MKVEVDIPELESWDEMKMYIRSEIAERMTDEFFRTIDWELYKPTVSQIAQEFKNKIKNDIDDMKQQIIDATLRKRDLRELCTSDTKNKQFIEEVINDCLRKKLGG